MKKFSENYNKINESKEVQNVSLEDKLEDIINEHIIIQFENEPKVNKNYSLEGKDEIKNKISSLYKENLNNSKKSILESVKKQYSKNIDIKEINENIERLKGNYSKGEIIMRDNLIYLVLENCTVDDEWIKVFQIGSLQKSFNNNKLYTSLIFNTSVKKGIPVNGIIGIRNNHFIKIPDQREMNVILDAINKPISKRYIEIIKERTGIDLYKMKTFKELNI